MLRCLLKRGSIRPDRRGRRVRWLMGLAKTAASLSESREYVRVLFDSHFCSQSVLLEPCPRRFLLLCEAPGILLASRQKVGEVNFCVIPLVNGVGWRLGLFSGVVAVNILRPHAVPVL